MPIMKQWQNPSKVKFAISVTARFLIRAEIHELLGSLSWGRDLRPTKLVLLPFSGYAVVPPAPRPTSVCWKDTGQADSTL